MALLTLKSNREFLDLYHPYIKTEWRRHYFFYDRLKAEYKALKEQKLPNLQQFEEDFLAEIKRVDWFLKITLDDISQDLRMIEEAKEPFQNQKSGLQKQQTEHTIEVAIRSIFEKCKACEQFYQLNHFVICKIAKKFEKLIESTHASHKKKNDPDGEHKLDFVPWTEYRSNEFFRRDFSRRSNKIVKLKQQCILLYSDFFRQKYPSLAFGELEFMKNKDREHKRTRTIFGIKLGLIIALISWVVFDSAFTYSSFDFWVQPGLYVYTTVGNMLLFRLLWSLNIFVWSRYDINYIPLLSLENLKPNLLAVSNSTATQFVLYALNLVIFFEANSPSTPLLYRSPLRYICPFLLLVWSICFEAYEYFVRFNGLSIKYSLGLFSRDVFLRCFIAPFTAVRFREVFAADVMTSFTKVISDVLYASCWILSGQFLVPPEKQDHFEQTAFGSNALVCSSSRMVIAVAIAVCIPLWIRLCQCLRQWRDNKWQTWPFVFNALKYLSSIAVVVYGTNTSVHSIDPTYMNLVIITTLYKWWWDVVMDWGLFEVMPTLTDIKTFFKRSSAERRRRRSTAAGSPHSAGSHSSNASTSSGSQHMPIKTSVAAPAVHPEKTYWHYSSHHREKPRLFLRRLLMYPSHYVYYIAIVLDLILRFMWVASLVPKELFGSFVGPQLSFFLCSMEIIRRAMWGVFRLEYEHLKNVQKGAVGFLKYRRTSYDFSRRQPDNSHRDRDGDNGLNSSTNSSPAKETIATEAKVSTSSPFFDSNFLRRGFSISQLTEVLRATERQEEIELMHPKRGRTSSEHPISGNSGYGQFPDYEELPNSSLSGIYNMEVPEGDVEGLDIEENSDRTFNSRRRRVQDEEGATDVDDEHPGNRFNIKKRDVFNADFSMHTMVAIQAMMNDSHHGNSNVDQIDENIAVDNNDDSVQPFHRANLERARLNLEPDVDLIDEDDAKFGRGGLTPSGKPHRLRLNASSSSSSRCSSPPSLSDNELDRSRDGKKLPHLRQTSSPSNPSPTGNSGLRSRQQSSTLSPLRSFSRQNTFSTNIACSLSEKLPSQSLLLSDADDP